MGKKNSTAVNVITLAVQNDWPTENGNYKYSM